MEIRDGWMIGRGVADDKGPMVATLYALKFLKEEGVSLRYPIRALVGDNEETHMHDVDYYLANYPAPVFCFTLQRREGPLRRQAGQPGLQRRHQGL